MTSVSFTVCTAFGFLGDLKHNKQMTFGAFLGLAGLREAYSRSSSRIGGSALKMCRGSNVKDKHVSAFQLESLILAQNERWRQA